MALRLHVFSASFAQVLNNRYELLELRIDSFMNRDNSATVRPCLSMHDI